VAKWTIGKVTVTKVVEVEVGLRLHHLLTDTDPEALQTVGWLEPYLTAGAERFKLSIHALVVDTPTTRIVVDTCVGNDKPREMLRGVGQQTAFLADLEAAGVARGSVDVVLCTHLHVDHVGWNTMLVDGKWVPTFPNARYLISKTEFDYWRGREDQEAPEIFADSIKPVFDAGQVDLVEPDHRIDETVTLVPTHGHTPGHVSVRISSEGQEAMITGDMIHHPCQFKFPHWCSTVDFDPAASTATRRRMFAEAADQPLLVIGTHFADPTAGHVVSDGDSWRFES
jgi:glyoxylase-like metal-dependent hydrolase (beta-lactamase superfamily II)